MKTPLLLALLASSLILAGCDVISSLTIDSEQGSATYSAKGGLVVTPKAPIVIGGATLTANPSSK